MKSIFIAQDSTPDNSALQVALGHTYPFWQQLKDHVVANSVPNC